MSSAVATATGHPCNWASCRTICSSDQALYEHLLEDHTAPWQNRDVSPYQRLACQWTGCETEPNWQRLRDHLTTHTNYRPFVCNVSPNCTMRFKTSHTLHIHLKRKDHRRPHTIKSTPSCEWKACTETLADPPALFEHISEVHAESGSKIICLWTECAHRSALKWRLDLRLPRWYKPILYEPDDRGKTSLMHAHMNTAGVGVQKRKREVKESSASGDVTKGDLGTKGELQVESKRQRAPAPKRADAESEDDKIAYVDDVHDSDYAPGRRASRRGTKRLRKSGVEDEEDDPDASPNGRTHKAKRLRACDPNVGGDGDDKDMAHRCNGKRLKVHVGESEDEDVAYEDNNCIPSPGPSLSWTSESALGSASSPAVVTLEQEQESPSTTIAAADLRSDIDTDERLAAVELRAQTLEAQLAAAFSVIRQSEVLRAKWVSHMSENADDAYEPRNSVTEMSLDQDTRMTMEDELEPDDRTLWVTGARGAP